MGEAGLHSTWLGLAHCLCVLCCVAMVGGGGSRALNRVAVLASNTHTLVVWEWWWLSTLVGWTAPKPCQHGGQHHGPVCDVRLHVGPVTVPPRGDTQPCGCRPEPRWRVFDIFVVQAGYGACSTTSPPTMQTSTHRHIDTAMPVNVHGMGAL